MHCPRCGSSNVREVKTTRILEALSCRECRYNFTTVADTYFHGSRIPTFEQLQFVTAVSIEPESSASRLARFFRWKTTTVGRQLSKLEGIRVGNFAQCRDGYKTFENFPSAIEYLEQPAIVLKSGAFEDRLGELLATSGRALRRLGKSTTSPKLKLEPMRTAKFSPLPRGVALALPSSLQYLADSEAAYDLVDYLRWDRNRRACPRCNSQFVLPIRTNASRELHRCVDCNYMFNALAGTIFQGTKMPVHRYFQFFVLSNAMDKIRIQDICFALECSYKTAALWLKRGKNFTSIEKFAFVNPQAAARMKTTKTNAAIVKEPFFSYCEMKGIVVNEAHFMEYARGVCRTTLKLTHP